MNGAQLQTEYGLGGSSLLRWLKNNHQHSSHRRQQLMKVTGSGDWICRTVLSDETKMERLDWGRTCAWHDPS